MINQKPKHFGNTSQVTPSPAKAEKTKQSEYNNKDDAYSSTQKDKNIFADAKLS